jgi:hypothetical protein
MTMRPVAYDPRMKKRLHLSQIPRVMRHVTRAFQSDVANSISAQHRTIRAVGGFWPGCDHRFLCHLDACRPEFQAPLSTDTGSRYRCSPQNGATSIESPPLNEVLEAACILLNYRWSRPPGRNLYVQGFLLVIQYAGHAQIRAFPADHSDTAAGVKHGQLSRPKRHKLFNPIRYSLSFERQATCAIRSICCEMV